MHAHLNSDGPVSEEAVRALFPSGASPVMIIAAHPDDEVLGAGALLAHLQGVHFVHITDGAPKNMRATKARGFATREEYTLARRGELASVFKNLAPDDGAIEGRLYETVRIGF